MGFTNHPKELTVTDARALDAPSLQLDEALFHLDAIAPTCATHAALLVETVAAIRAADALLAGVTLACVFRIVEFVV